MNLSLKLRCKDKHYICNNAAYPTKKIVAFMFFYTMQCFCTPRH